MNIENADKASANPVDALVMRGILIGRAKDQLAEINQYLADVAHWNEPRTRFEQIDPDPDGEMCRLRETLVRFLGLA